MGNNPRKTGTLAAASNLRQGKAGIQVTANSPLLLEEHPHRKPSLPVMEELSKMPVNFHSTRVLKQASVKWYKNN